MAEATAQTQEKSLWDRISETSADIANKALLVRRGVQQSIAGIPAIPGYIVDLGNMGVKKLGGTGYEGSAGGWIQNKVMQAADATQPDFLKPTIKTESDQKWADYTEIGTDVALSVATLGAGSVKLAGTGAKLVTKAAVKEAVKETAEATAKTTAKVTVEDTTAILAKAKAAGEAERAGVKATFKESAEASAETGAKTGFTAAANAGAKTTAEAVASTSKSLLSTAATAGSYAWTAGKVATFPFRHPVLTLSGLGAAHVATGGASSELVWDGAIGGWNATKEYAPAVASTVAEGTLKIGDGFMGFLATGGKKGAESLGDHLPPGTPLVLREALGSVGKSKPNAADGSAAAPSSLTAQASEAFEGAKERTEDARAEMGDFLEGEHAKPFRDMLGKSLGIDGKDVNGKVLVDVLKEKAKNEPAIGLGMALGAMSGMKSSSSKAEMAWKVPLYTALWGVAFMMLGPILNPLLKAFGGWAGDKMNDLKQNGGLANQFHGAQVDPYMNGALPSTAVAPGQKVDTTAPAANDAVTSFRDNGNMMTAPVADVSKLGVNTKAPAANRDLWAMTMNG